MQNREGTDVTITIDRESEYCIFKVHNVLRNVNERAYEPEIISIGPFHRGKSHLQMMEEHKLRFRKLLVERQNGQESTYFDAVKRLEKDARNCYAEPINLSTDEFVKMMVLDGCFIIELLRKFKMLKDSPDKNNLPQEIKNDPLFRTDWPLIALQQDLMLFENQLPFFILTELYQLANETVQAQLPDETIQAQLPNETIQTQLPDETIQTQLPNGTVQAQLLGETVQLPNETVQAELPGETVQLPGETAQGELPGETAQGELPGETVPVQLPGETAQAELPGETVPVQLPNETAQAELPGETAQAELPGETAQAELPGETVPVQLPNETAQAELPGETIQLPGETAQAELPGETTPVQLPNEMAQAELPGETIQVPGETVQVQLPNETAQSELPGETIQVPGETVQLPDETAQAEPPDETIEAEPPDETVQAELPVETIQAELPDVTVQLPDVTVQLPDETAQAELLDETVQCQNQENELVNLALLFFNDLFPGHGKCQKTGVQDKIKHLLDLIHKNWSIEKLESNRDGTCNMDNINLIRCSTELAVAGIKFQKIDGEVSLFDIQFSNGLLQIPAFTIEDRTESFLRNLMAYEQYCGDPKYNIVTDYMTFLGCLIKSAEDVKKLSRNGIVRNFVGDDAVIYQMVNGMNKHIVGPSRSFYYVEIFKSVNIQCERRWNKCMAILRRKYVNSSWGIISILAASTLVVLALVQALFQILSWKKSLV